MPILTLESLLARGYLTEELPPPFTSRPFAAAIIGHLQNLPPEFTEAGQPPSKPVRHHLVRPGNLPRRFAVPNPSAAAVMATLVVDKWNELHEIHRQSRYSLSRPIPSDDLRHRALIWTHTRTQQDARRAEVRVAARYVVRADISLFYPSLYTHALPWTLHSKAVAKQRPRDYTLLGNRLDRALRTGQDFQTLGIPIGPSWSLALSELVTSRVDAALQASFPNLQCMRTLDDYEFGAESETDAERILAALRSLLADYELQLNATKTAVAPVPVPMMPAWKAALRSFQIRWRSQSDDLIRYFDLAASLGQSSHTAAPVSWAAHRMRWLKVKGRNWPLVQDLLLHSVMVEAGCIKNAMRALLEHTREGWPINNVAVRDTLSSVIIRHVPLGSSSEVAWALWAAIAFGIRLPDEVGQTLTGMPDSVIALLAMDADQRGLLGGLDKSAWASLISSDELRSDHWLLAYEAPRKGWLGTKAHFHVTPEFNALDAWDVEFYDSASRLGAVPGVFEPLAPPPLPPAAVVPQEELPGAEVVAPRPERPHVLDLFDVPTSVESDGDDDPYP